LAGLTLIIKAVIFDLDGTIASFNIDYMAARAEIIGLLTEQGLPSSLLSLKEGVFDMLKKAKKHMENSGNEENEFLELKKKAISIVERYESEAARKTSLLPNVLKTLKTLREMKLKLAICTTNGEKSTNHILKRFHITHFFEAVITRESVSAVKPDPAHLEAALKALNIRPEEAIVVGDSARDMECAQKLNVLAVGVTTGISSQEALTIAGANYLASSSADIPTLVEQLNRQG
jgi:phosphoglycolate phosphatase